MFGSESLSQPSPHSITRGEYRQTAKTRMSEFQVPALPDLNKAPRVVRRSKKRRAGPEEEVTSEGDSSSQASNPKRTRSKASSDPRKQPWYNPKRPEDLTRDTPLFPDFDRPRTSPSTSRRNSLPHHQPTRLMAPSSPYYPRSRLYRQLCRSRKRRKSVPLPMRRIFAMPKKRF
ncbi:hypothetical protein TWF694_003785 [Orbilia ellipsospora]|uniref:Uncharacterized protein n=1 Tax=Orbilia ellipsospora TaxID=2528407 RepID=A0AAV9X0G9_9PEZI